MLDVGSILDTVQCADAFVFMDGLPPESVDLVICDGPYGVTSHEWDRVGSIQEFNLSLLKAFAKLLKPGGSVYLFGKPDCIDFIDYRSVLTLKARIVWYQPSRLAQGRRNYTNNYDVICYFSKGPANCFNLDEIRVPQLVELEHRLRCEKVPSVKNGRYAGTKFNDQGKNPGDVWGDIKQLTYKSKELVGRELLNTIQKPERLMERILKASSNLEDVVLDVFAGTGTVPVVCSRLGRHFIACELNPQYVEISTSRLRDVKSTSPLFQECSTEPENAQPRSHDLFG
jgi:DNA modification methylase